MRPPVAFVALALWACSPPQPRAAAPAPAVDRPAPHPEPAPSPRGPSCTAWPARSLDELVSSRGVELSDDPAVQQSRDLLALGDAAAVGCLGRANGESCRAAGVLAVEIYREVLALHPANGAAAYASHQLATVLFAMENYHEALDALVASRALSRRGSDRQHRALLELGDKSLPAFVAAASASAAEALGTLELVDRSSPDPATLAGWRDDLGDAFSALLRFDEARAVFDALARDEPWRRCWHGARALESAMWYPDLVHGTVIPRLEAQLAEVQSARDSAWYTQCRARTAAAVHHLAIDLEDAFWQRSRVECSQPPAVLLDWWERAVLAFATLADGDYASLVLHHDPHARCPEVAALLAMPSDVGRARRILGQCEAALRALAPSGDDRDDRADRMIARCVARGPRD